MVAGSGKLVGNILQVVSDTLFVFLRGIDRQSSSHPLIVLIGDSILRVGSEQSPLVMVENIFLAGTSIRINSRRAKGCSAQ